MAVASSLAAVALLLSGCRSTCDRTDCGPGSFAQAPDRTVGALEPAALDLDRSSSARTVPFRDCVRARESLKAIRRASRWVASFPEPELRFDAAIGLYHIRKSVDGAALRGAWKKAKVVADRDDDHPMHRFWDPQHRALEEQVQGWRPPSPGRPRANVNRVVTEALYCDVYSLRDETLSYLSGPMRDDGGYHTTHALWALVIAHDNGCIDDAVYEDLAQTMQQELVRAQPATLTPKVTLDVDLYAERTLMLVLSDYRDGPLRHYLDELTRVQSDDGSWGVVIADEPPYYRYHATMTAAWALSASLHRERGTPMTNQPGNPTR